MKTINERLGVSMDPRVRYIVPRYDRFLTLGPLSDKKIEAYLKAGKYDRARFHRLTDRPEGRLVYSA